MKEKSDDFENIAKVLEYLGYDIKKIKKILSKGDFLIIIRDLLIILDSILKSTRKFPFHYETFNKKELGSETILSFDILSLLKRIKEYFTRLNLSVIKMDSQLKISFIYVLDNVLDFYTEYLSLKNKKDVSELLKVYLFWISTFVNNLNELLSGEFSFRNLEENNNYSEVFFKATDLSINLSPYLLYDNRKKKLIYLNNISNKGFNYVNKDGELEFIFINKRYFDVVYENSINMLALMDVKKLHEFKEYHDYKILPFHYLQSIATDFAFNIFVNSESNLMKIADVNDKYPVFLYLLAYVSYLKADYRNALRKITSFVDNYPSYSSGYELFAEINYKLKDYEKALKYFEMAYNIHRSDKIKAKINNLKTTLKENEENLAKKRTYNEELIDFNDKTDVPIIARENELNQLIEILISNSRNNALIIGDSGIGKTTLIKLLSKKISNGEVPNELKNRKLKELNFVALLTGSKYRGQFEEKALKFLAEFSKTNDILVLENIHLMSSAGSSRGTSLDFLTILREFLKDNSVQVIATTTYEELKNTIEKDNYLTSFFQKIIIMELGKKDSEKILRSKVTNLYENDDIYISDDLIASMVDNAKRYIREKRLPDSAIMIFERSIAKFKMKRRSGESVLNEEIVRDVIGDLLNTSISNITLSFKNKLLNLEENLKKSIVGQSDAIKRLSSSVITAKMEFYTKPSRPDGIFLFIGPTGVGKTETAIALTKLLYGSVDYLIRIDMSEYMEKFTYSRFIGSAPGYVGYNDTNQLTDKVRQNPFSIILLDEIEKADAELLNIFLQIFDAGRLTDSKGNTVDFSNTTFILTSNIGTSLFSYTKMGYESEFEENYVSDSMLIKNLKKHFTPEFLNRIDDIIIFKHLSKESIKKIIDLQLIELRKKLNRENKSLILKPEVFDLIAEKGYSKEYGARNLSRIITKELLEKMAILSLSKEWEMYKEIVCFVEDKKIIVKGNYQETYLQSDINKEIEDYIIK